MNSPLRQGFHLLQKIQLKFLNVSTQKEQEPSVFYKAPPPLLSQILNAITCAQLALIFLQSLDHMGGRFSLSQGCNVTS